jgi:hypothetical protein
MQASTGSKEKSENNSGAKISRKSFTVNSCDNLSLRHPGGLNMTQARHLLALSKGDLHPCEGYDLIIDSPRHFVVTSTGREVAHPDRRPLSQCCSPPVIA